MTLQVTAWLVIFALDRERSSFFPQSHVRHGPVKMQTMQTADWGFFFKYIISSLFIFIIIIIFLTLNFSLLALNRVFLLLSWFPVIFPMFTPLWKS